VGKTLEAITLQISGDGWTEALSDNYLKVQIAGEHEPNKILKVDVMELSEEYLVAMAPTATTHISESEFSITAYDSRIFTG
jgi:hypothetical protein